MLKPALARGELHCVGATTLDEYRKYVEKDAALERRFQKVLVGEPSVEATIAILRGLQEKYELHHGVDITDPAIVAAAELSHRYITDRFLPDKAIDLIDEAAAKIKMEIDSRPESMDKLDRRIIQLKIEQEALKKETDSASKDRLVKLEGELAELEEKSAALTARWHAEKDKLGSEQKFKEQIEAARTELAQAQRRWLASSPPLTDTSVSCIAAGSLRGGPAAVVSGPVLRALRPVRGRAPGDARPGGPRLLSLRVSWPAARTAPSTTSRGCASLTTATAPAGIRCFG